MHSYFYFGDVYCIGEPISKRSRLGLGSQIWRGLPIKGKRKWFLHKTNLSFIYIIQYMAAFAYISLFEKNSKKSKKLSKNHLTKRDRCGNITRSRTRGDKKPRKKFWKVEKSTWQRIRVCDIITELYIFKGWKRIGHWKLNNKRLKKYKAKASIVRKKISLEILKRILLKQKVKEARKEARKIGTLL